VASNSKKSITWTTRVKSKKSGNRPQADGKWGKGEYIIYSVSIPSDLAKELGLTPKTTLDLRASIAEPIKKKEK
jgi:hypothetical protein